MGPRAATFGKRVSGLRVVARSRRAADRRPGHRPQHDARGRILSAAHLPLLQSRRRRRRRPDRARRPRLDRPVPALPLVQPRPDAGRRPARRHLGGARARAGRCGARSADRRGRASPTTSSPRRSSTSTACSSCRRSSGCCATRQPDAVANVAATIRRKIGYADDGGPDYPFLSAYYNAGAGADGARPPVRQAPRGQIRQGRRAGTDQMSHSGEGRNP